MTRGERENDKEKLIKLEKRIKSVETDMMGWDSELARAIRKSDEDYMDFCICCFVYSCISLIDLMKEYQKQCKFVFA